MRKTNYLGKAIMLFSLSLFLMSSDCEPEDLEEEREPIAENCGAYEGPTGDIQSDVFCQVAWSARCSGKNDEADANCKIYKQLQAQNPGLENCPYCP